MKQYVLIEMKNEAAGTNEYGESVMKAKPVVHYIADSPDAMKAHLKMRKQFKNKLQARGIVDDEGELVVAQYDPTADE